MAVFRGYDISRLGDSAVWRRTIFFGLTVGAFGTAALWVAQLQATAPYQTLIKARRDTEAVVTSYRPDVRDGLQYRFSVAGREYLGGSREDSAGSYTVGQTLRIAYAATDPAINCACDPQLVAGDEAGALVGAVFIALGAAGVFLMASPMVRPR